ncbi:hypothetical protein HK099_000794 [Clydaea vesicula]|uniref:Uncharacterized protein n=1 Tax=Clydaea vesicula TaxID=447962 RepID=A0AAD5XZD0_9FUNG|nr:hypothetical protein HK099_000794 [Clydaea vesicula]
MLANSSQLSSRRSTTSIPRPSETLTSGEAARSRNKRRDDAIRRKVEQELSRKKPARKTSSMTLQAKRNALKGTVASLKPNPAITVLESARIANVAQLMAAKRSDAVLVVNEEGQLSGILTDKDICFRVVAAGLDSRTTCVAQVMTPNPIFVFDKGSRTEALSIMTERNFRHLPVISEVAVDEESEVNSEGEGSGVGTNVVGLLDITKCVFDRLDDLEKKVNEDENIIKALETLERRGGGSVVSAGSTPSFGCPDVGSVISSIHDGLDILCEVSVKASVRDAAKVMKERHHTAVLVLNHSTDGPEFDKLGGIFTTKDVVLRVIAAGLDPATTSVIRVMTPHPDSVTVNTTILDALKKLHIGHYLHLPVVSGTTPVGLLDVQQLTMAMLNYLISKDVSNNQESGPMWNKFWNSTFAPHTNSIGNSHSQMDDFSDNLSISSAGGNSVDYGNSTKRQSHHSRSNSQRSELRSLTHHGKTVVSSPQQQNLSTIESEIVNNSFVMEEKNLSYPFKIKDLINDTKFWITSTFDDYELLLNLIKEKLNGKSNSSIFRLTYEDDEGDLVLIECDRDLREAVNVSKRENTKRVQIYLDFVDSAMEKKKDYSNNAISKLSNDNNSQVLQFLYNAPLPVNVALSAGIIVIAGWVFHRLTQ